MRGQGSAEFALVSACAGWPPSPARVRAAAARGFSPDALAAVALRHGVSGLVVQSLSLAAIPVPPRLRRAARARRGEALRQAAEALRLDGLFRAAGVPVVVLKGTALAAHLYGSAALRDSVDIDLAVAPEHVDRAWAALDAAGYRPCNPRTPPGPGAARLFRWAAKDSLHRHPGQNAAVELHWRLSDELASRALPPPGRWQTVEIASGRGVATLGDEELFAYLCTHGAAHGWARLKWLADIAALIAASDDGGASHWRAAKAAGAGRAAASALILANALLATELPPGFVPPRSRRLALLNRLAVRTMAAGGGARELAATPWRGWTETAAKLLVAPGGRAVTGALRRLLVSPEDVGALGLPPPLAFLYPLLRIPRLVARRVGRRGR